MVISYRIIPKAGIDDRPRALVNVSYAQQTLSERVDSDIRCFRQVSCSARLDVEQSRFASVLISSLVGSTVGVPCQTRDLPLLYRWSAPVDNK